MSPPEISQLETNAQSGDPAAQLALGRAYDEGNGVPQSDKLGGEVVPGSRRSGKCNCPDTGLMFRSGRGVDEDKVEEVKWYRKAAKKENPNALFNMRTAAEFRR